MNSQVQADNNSNSHNTMIYSYESIRIRQIKHLYPIGMIEIHSAQYFFLLPLEEHW